ncbi:MAG: hypothetical protein LWW88_03650 [Acinetobacter sp.]|uniref:hypothetical protein n=1 Tax=Acinetobacter sp. TaxID=472 RepID=UPI00258F8E1A|nr:hypothetical protein [Acinetobacter sp.]MCE1270652.1 hypothetical protein [Acinetobacter sp.]
MINVFSETKDDSMLMSLRTTSSMIAVSKAIDEVVWYVEPNIITQQHTPIELENGNTLICETAFGGLLK